MEEAKTYSCRYCGGTHGSLAAIAWCVSNPKRQEMIEKNRNSGRLGAIAANSKPELVEKRRQAARQYMNDPANAAKVAAARSKGGRNSPHDFNKGKPATPRQRLALLMGIISRHRRDAPAVLERQVDRAGLVAPVLDKNHDFFRGKAVREGNDLWIEVGNDDDFTDF